jgi:hypothetical protein
MPYQRYWDEDEHLDGLRRELIEAIAGADTAIEDLPGDVAPALADAIMKRVFKRVKLHTWCDIPRCFRAGCAPTHYTFDLTTYPRRFAAEQGEESNAGEPAP